MSSEGEVNYNTIATRSQCCYSPAVLNATLSSTTTLFVSWIT